MALQEETERTADVGGWEDDEARTFGKGPQLKYVFSGGTLALNAGVMAAGKVCTYAQQDLNGTDEQYFPPDRGKPVIGNFLNPKKFHWRLSMRQQHQVVLNQSECTNMFSFRLVFLLVWQFPQSLSGVLPGLGVNDFLAYFGEDVPFTSDFMLDFMKTDVREKCVLLYDCVHSIGSPGFHMPVLLNNITKAAGGQAGYIVGPADPGYVVPAATDTAITTTQAAARTGYGGHQMFLDGEIDIQPYCEQAALWRDPAGAVPNQIVPYVVCFVASDSDYMYFPSTTFAVADRPTPTFKLSTRYEFSDD